MSIKKNFSLIRAVLVIVAVLSIVVLFAGCSNDAAFNIDEMTLVILEGNGGKIDGFNTRELYYKPGSKLLAPTDYSVSEMSSSPLGLIKRTGYTLVGWYTAQTANYNASEDGIYVKLDAVYDTSSVGDYVLVYEKDEKGAYAKVEISTTDAEGNVSTTEEYQVYKPTVEEHKSAERYSQVFVAFDEDEHDGMMRYEKTTENAYAIYDELFIESSDGAYVLNEDGTYSYDKDGKLEGVHYELAPEFEYDGDVTALTKYNATFTYNEEDKWDFSRDRVGEEELTLYANWKARLAVNYIYWDGSGHTTYDNAVGKTIAKPTGTARDGGGRTFVCWSKQKDVLDPWNFVTDTYPADTNSIDLYAYYVEGDYTRVTTVADLKKVANNLAGSYVLCDNLDLTGSTGNPLGFSAYNEKQAFTGVFEGMGFSITGVKMSIANKTFEAKNFGLFYNTDGAQVRNLKVDITAAIALTSRGDVTIGCFTGNDNNSTFTNCEGTLKVTGNNLSCNVTVLKADGVTLDTSELTTKATLTIK